MSILGKPVPPPPRPPADFDEFTAAPGWATDFDAFHNWPGGVTSWRDRPIIAPRIIVLHTNAASVEASLDSQRNWGNAHPNNTKPHACVNAPQPTLMVPATRRAIANSTGSDVEDRLGVDDASFWSIAVETADMGWKAAEAAGILGNSDIGPFLYDHAELIARQCAVWCLLFDIPAAPLTGTDHDFVHGRGIVTHTEPWPYPYLTTARGKWCPGLTKKQQTLNEIIPRTAEIIRAWTEEADDMPISNEDIAKIADAVQASVWSRDLKRGKNDEPLPAGQTLARTENVVSRLEEQVADLTKRVDELENARYVTRREKG